MGSTSTANFDPQPVLNSDPWLEPFLPAIAHRHGRFQQWKSTIAEYEGGYEKFSRGYEKFGLNVDEKGAITYREWAPNAKEAVVIGDFSECSCLCFWCFCMRGCVYAGVNALWRL